MTQGYPHVRKHPLVDHQTYGVADLPPSDFSERLISIYNQHETRMYPKQLGALEDLQEFDQVGLLSPW